MNQVGTYMIDLIQTRWRKYDKNKFKNVKIIFYQNGTYSVNMKVPFLVDTTGTWVEAEGGFEEYGEIAYSNSKFKCPTYGRIKKPYYYVSIEWPIPQKNMPYLELLVLKKQGNDYKLHEDDPSWISKIIIYYLIS